MSNNFNTLGQGPTPRSALVRLIIVLAFAIGFVIYAYGWTVTDIDLEKPTEARRQENLQNALRELLSPNLFQQEVELSRMEAQFLVGCDSGIPLDAVENDDGFLEVTPRCGDPGDHINIIIRDFETRVDARVRWIPPGEDAEVRPREILETGRQNFVLDDNGEFTGTIEVPRIRGTEGQVHTIIVLAAVPVGSVELSQTSKDVLQRMGETIFMALVATSIAIPIAAFISFFAAQNLMRPIRLSLGSTLLTFLGFVLGIWLGGILLTPVVDRGFEFSRDGWTGAAYGLILLMVITAGVVAFYRYAARSMQERMPVGSWSAKIVSVIQRLVMVTALAFVVGIVGGMLLAVGEKLVVPPRVDASTIRDGIGGIGSFLSVNGGITELATGLVAMLIGGFALSGILTTLFAAPLRVVPALLSHLIAGGMGLVSGGVLFFVLGRLGVWAALLGLLAPIVAALMGGAITVLLYRMAFPRDIRKRGYEPNMLDDLMWWVVFAVGALIVFYLTFRILNTRIALVNGVLPSENRHEFLGLSLRTYVINNILIGAVLGGIGGALAGVRGSFALGSTMYNVSRTLLNTVRSIEPLIMGLVFVIWVGIGPFAGVMALTLHSIAALGKLYSEQVESIDPGPVEALDSTGASRLQTIVYGVVPQVIPPYIAFTMYRWDINVRMSTIIGFVGGGGIGLLLQQQINLLQYRGAGVAVLAIAIVVSILDYVSAYIRSRVM